MKILLIANFSHNVSKKLVNYLKLKKINFDHIDCAKEKKIIIYKNYDYLISFLNNIYITKKVRKKIKFNSFNFHPGPPEYPGFGCYNFALLDNANFYGSTVHIIDDKFDHGKIINVKRFRIFKEICLEKLIDKTHTNILKQAKIFIKDILKKKIEINSKIKWKRKAYTKKDFEIAREVKFDDSVKNILKKVKAFTYKNYESVYINLRGFKFVLKKK